MSDLAISIAVNVALGAILLALLYWKRPIDEVRLQGAQEALQQFAQHFPEAVGIATVADDQRHALIELQRGEVGLLQRHARRWNARILSLGELRSVEQQDDSLKLRFNDFGWPGAQIRITDAAARSQWRGRLEALQLRGTLGYRGSSNA